MRVRIAAPALTGAIALGVLAMPATAFAATAGPVITKAVSPSADLGLGGTITLGTTITATDASGIKAIYAEPYPVALVQQYGGAPTAAELKADAADSLLKVESKTATSQTAGVSETDKILASDKMPDEFAGTWGVAVLVVANNGTSTFNVKATTYNWQRADKLTSKVSATKVRKGANLTITGQLDRANWATDAYQDYDSQSVLLEFLKTGATTWTTVKHVTSSNGGALTATVEDSTAGSWRYVYAGNSTSGAAASAQTSVGLE